MVQRCFQSEYRMSHSLLACGSRGGSTESILAWKRHSSVTGEACKHRCSSVSVTRLQIVGTDNCMMQLHMYILYTHSNAKSYVYTCMCLIPLLGYSTMIVLHVYSIWECGENSGHQLALIGRAGASPPSCAASENFLYMTYVRMPL